MRIKNGPGYTRSGYSQHDATDSARTANFRQHHRVGQTVFGRLIRWERPGMAWVNIDNSPLLASISSHPAPGARLTFLIRKLTPEIVLQERSEDATNTPSIIDIITEFNTLRTKFETASAPLWEQMKALDAEATRAALFKVLSSNPTAYSAFLNVTACVVKINGYTNANKTFCYWPWLMPGTRGQATLVQKKNDSSLFYEITHEFESIEHGLAHMQLLYKHPEASYRLLLQRNASKMKTMTHDHTPPSVDIHCIGISPLPRSSLGGLLTSALME